MSRTARRNPEPTDLGQGWFVQKDRAGSCVTFVAMLLNEPGGFLIGAFRKTFGYKRDATTWVEQMRDTPEVAQARLRFAEWIVSPKGLAALRRAEKFDQI